MTGAVPVLVYHSIASEAAPAFRRWTVAPDRFACHMNHLASEGYQPLTVTEYARRLAASDVPSRPVVITFDDGYADFRSHALPLLRNYGLKATLFVTTGYIGGTSQWLRRVGESSRPMLSWEDLEHCAGADLEFGAHGHTHRHMDTLSVEEARADLAWGKALLESRMGRPVTSLSYPDGYSTSELRQAVADMGLEAACGVVHAMTSPADDRYNMARIIVDADVDTDTFAGFLDGSELPVAPMRNGMSQTASRWLRKGRIALGLDDAHMPT